MLAQHCTGKKISFCILTHDQLVNQLHRQESREKISHYLRNVRLVRHQREVVKSALRDMRLQQNVYFAIRVL